MASRASPRVPLDTLSTVGAVVPRTRLGGLDWPAVGASALQQSSAACPVSSFLAKTTGQGAKGVLHAADQLGTWDWDMLCVESSRRSHPAGGDRYVAADSRHVRSFNSN